MTLRPNVRIQTTIRTSLLQADSAGNAFLIATATWGEENTLLQYVGSSGITNAFKGGALPINANIYVAGGGRNLNIYRFVPVDAEASTETFQNDATNVITITAKYKGTYGNNIWVRIDEQGTGRKITISDDVSTEILDNEGDSNGYATNTLLVAAINDNSNLVTAELDAATPLVDTYAKTLLTGGLQGTAITASNVQTIVEDLFDLSYTALLVPELTGDSDHNTIGGLMESRGTNNNEFSLFVTGISKDESYATTITRTASTLNGRLVVLVPGTYEWDGVQYSGGYGASFYAGLLLSLPTAESATNKPFGLSKFINGASKTVNYNNLQVEKLIEGGFTVINKVGNFQAPIRAVTKIGDITNPFFEQSVRMSMDVIQNALINLLNPFIGKKNTDIKKIQMKGIIDSYLNRSISDEIINDFGSEVLDGISPTEIRINLAITPVFPINTIVVNLTI